MKRPKAKPDPAPPQSGPFPPDAVSLEDAARLALRRRQMLRKWCVAGRLPYWRIGRIMLVRQAHAEQIGQIPVDAGKSGFRLELPDFNDLA